MSDTEIVLSFIILVMLVIMLIQDKKLRYLYNKYKNLEDLWQNFFGKKEGE